MGTQPCLTLRDPMDCILPGFSVHGILQAQEYWSERPFPPSQDVPDTGIQPESPTLAVDFFTAEPPGKF